MLQQYITGSVQYLASLFGMAGIGSKIIKDPPVK